MNNYKYFEKAGIVDADNNVELVIALENTKLYSEADTLSGMAYYDAYIKRRYGIIDEEGYEL